MGDFYILWTSSDEIKTYFGEKNNIMAIEWKVSGSLATATISKEEYDALKKMQEFMQDVENHVIGILKRPVALPNPKKQMEIEHSYEFYKMINERIEKTRAQIAGKYSCEDLELHLADAIEKIKLQDAEYNRLLACYTAVTTYVNPLNLPREKIKQIEDAIIHNRGEVVNIHSEAKKAAAIQSAVKRYANDSKQNAKNEVKEWWKKWQANPSIYKTKYKIKTKADFARTMLDKFDGILTSQKKIEDWCRAWEKEETSPC